ncbi:MAG TPA: SPOR domain-containing protein [Gammaproteobacteria bacterium]|nr:SPOR domain-containing protein [Gammaproteobacteria bacterium]
MTRDYAKKRGRGRNYSGSQRAKYSVSALIPGWVWLLIGIISGICLACFISWKWSQKIESRPPAPPIIISDTNTLKEEAEENKPRFDFYTLLPNLKVDLPDVATPPSARTQTNTKQQDASLAYIIQAGSFKTQDQADKRKATLALQGIESQIQTVNIRPEETWYRVYIGPFKTKEEAQNVQQNLEQNQALNSLILKIRV